jgi:hypothetical protein
MRLKALHLMESLSEQLVYVATSSGTKVPETNIAQA